MSPTPTTSGFPVLPPDLQVAFFHRLEKIRPLYLRASLADAVASLPIAQLDAELRDYVDPPILQRIASFGLRGEVFCPIPSLLRQRPLLLGYYRLLYGISQKEFYAKGPFGRFKRLEEIGEISEALESQLPALCRSLTATGGQLVAGIESLSLALVHELQLLTIGPQFRGGENTQIGNRATRQIMELVAEIVGSHVKERTRRAMVMQNAAGRLVLIEFASDPDVQITETLETGSRYVLSIEIKGGADVSNVHNRLGEAEKSHLKARKLGCPECWTIIKAAVPIAAARRASPSTTQFFRLDPILRKGDEYAAFRDALASRIGIV